LGKLECTSFTSYSLLIYTETSHTTNRSTYSKLQTRQYHKCRSTLQVSCCKNTIQPWFQYSAVLLWIWPGEI